MSGRREPSGAAGRAARAVAPAIAVGAAAETTANRPVDVVASRIVVRLLAEALVNESDAVTCVSGLASGTVRSGDWRLWIENQLERDKR